MLLDQVNQLHDEVTQEQCVVLFGQGDKRVQYILTALFRVEAWVPFADEKSSIQTFLEEAERA